jgi:DNA-binding transcriptional ArsR family regulator
MRIRTFLDGGVDGLLRSLRSVIQWRFPLLEVASVDGPDLHLDGRGLVLQPAYFCQGDAVGLIDRDQQPLLIYPIEPAVVGHGSTQSFRPAAHLGRGRRAGSDRLAALLGATRAAILGAVGVGGTTTDLGRRVGIAKASASHHVSALRAAGLVVSRRHGGAVLHTLTPLGDALLGGSLDDGPTDGR